MTFLPIVVRELRVASRRPATYWLRTTLGLAVSLIWLGLLASGRNGLPPSERGPVLFTAIGVLSLGFSLLAGVFLTADCLSEERREGTLGLLFLTELRGYDVLFGKLMATSLPACFGLMTVLPLLALPLLMGGVSLGEYWRVALVLLVTLSLSLCLGVAVSAFSRDARQAMSSTLAILIGLTGVLPLLGWLVHWLFKVIEWRGICYWPSPAFLYSRAFDSYYNWRRGEEFWGALATVAALATAALAMANLRLPRAWRQSAEAPAARRIGRWMQRWRLGADSFRVERRGLLQQDPFHWLATRDRMPPWVANATIGALFVLWLGFLAGSFSGKSPTREMCTAMAFLVAIGLHLVLKWLVAVEASRRLNEDHQSGALELLLVTPLSVNQILGGQRRALSGSFLFPMLLALLANTGLLWLTLRPSPMGPGSRELPTFCELILGGAFLLFADFHALTWVGMWMGLRSRRHQRAILATLGRVMLVPWLALLFIWFLGMSGVFASPGDAFVIFILWHGLGLVIDFIVATRARGELLRALKPALPATAENR